MSSVFCGFVRLFLSLCVKSNKVMNRDNQIIYMLGLILLFVGGSCKDANRLEVDRATKIALSSNIISSDSIIYYYLAIDKDRMFVQQILDFKNYQDTTCFYLLIANSDTMYVGVNPVQDTIFWYPYMLTSSGGKLWYCASDLDRGFFVGDAGFTKKIMNEDNSYTGNLFLFRVDTDSINWKLDNLKK